MINVDFLSTSYKAGMEREHNANTLSVTITPEMAAETSVVSYRIAFDGCENGPYRTTALQASNGKVTYLLPRTITNSQRVFMTLEQYTVDTLLRKSPMVTLFFNKSVADGGNTVITEPSVLQEVTANTAARHTHTNKTVIDKLTDSNGELLYNNAKIGDEANVFYGTCDTETNVATKVVSTTEGFGLRTGVIILVNFKNNSGGSSNSPIYLNVNSTGAHIVSYKTSDASDSPIIPIGEDCVGEFVYDGTRWVQTEVFVASGTTSGLVKLYDGINSSSDVDSGIAATPLAVKRVNDKVNSKAEANTVYTKTETDALLGEKVDKDGNKGLSTEDFTTDEKLKLASLTNNNPFYGVCSTAASTPAKTVTVDSTFALQNGVMIVVKFNNDCYKPATGNVTLNVNNLGARTVVKGALNPDIVKIPANTTVALVLSGNYWVQLGYYKATNNDPGFVELSDATNLDYGTIYGVAATPKAVKTVADSVATKESSANKVTSLSGSSTDTQYPSAKATYDAIQASKTTVNNTVQSTSTSEALSANMGKELHDEISNLKQRGRFLALWNCSTGLAMSNPQTSPYTYKTGDYFIVGGVASGTTNYKPNGSTYTIGVASSTVESNSVSIDDTYYYDGSTWRLQANTQKSLSFANIAGDPDDNDALAGAFAEKVDKVAGKGLSTNDFTDERRDKLAGIEAGAEVNPVNVSELNNDAGYLTQHQDITGKLNVNQGVANAGKAMVVGADGNLAPSEIASPLPLSVVNGKLCITYEESDT